MNCAACGEPISAATFDEAVCWADPDNQFVAAHATCILWYQLMGHVVEGEMGMAQAIAEGTIPDTGDWLWMLYALDIAALIWGVGP